MDLSVSGKQISVGQALRSHVKEKLASAVGKYFEKPMEGAVAFSREGHSFRADISVHVGRGIQMQGHALAEDPYIAYDRALDKVAKRLRRQKRWLRDHRKKAAAKTKTKATAEKPANPKKRKRATRG